MKILELFSGYGTASFALKRLGIPYELVGYSDIDKYANQCFAQNHGGKELGDVKLINPNDLPDFDLLTGGFPCQAFSNAGKMKGELEPRGTLFYEIIRIAEVKKPKYMLLENVKGLTCKKFKDTFDKILSELDRIGYNVYWKVLNSKDYGIPQSRARVWFVCFRKDIDKKDFKFPEPVELKIFIKDILESEVDKKYYLSENAINRLFNNGQGFHSSICQTISPTIFAQQHKISRGMCIAMRSYPRSGKNDLNRKQNLEPRYDGCSNTLTNVQKDNLVWREYLSKLTPKECFRLMGFLNDEINLDGLSDTQKYKLAGNGQDVNMVSKIFERIFA